MIRSFPFSTLTCVIAMTALAGCAPGTLPPPQGSLASASPTTGGPIDGTPKPDSGSAASATPSRSIVQYSCNNGSTIQARYPDNNHSVVSYQDRDLAMHIARSADGARYVGHDYEWWTRGTGQNAEATLLNHGDDGSAGDVVTTCHEQ